MEFFVADWHLGHANLVYKFGERPFKTLEEHDRTIIDNHNSRVGPKDDVYVLGDVCFAGKKTFLRYLDGINGRLHLIRGNHDRRLNAELKKRFVWEKDLHTLKIKKDRVYKIVLCHYPMRSWDGSSRGSWMLHGHDHGKLGEDPRLLSFCVSINTIGYFPLSFSQVKAKMMWIEEERKLL